jgi:RNA polymerase sigma-70 factor (ECF subfamily)
MASSDSHSGPPLQLVLSRSTAAVASDADVVRGLIHKEEWAAVALWSRYGSLVFRIADRALGSRHEAEDLTQDVFLCVLGKIAGLRDPAALRSFVVSVTIRTLKWKLRRKRVRQWVQLTSTGDLPDQPVNGVDVDETLRRFYRLLDKLRADDRLVFVLRRVDGMKLEDVGRATGHSLATVKRRLTRADAELAHWMEREPVLMTFLRNEGGTQ